MSDNNNTNEQQQQGYYEGQEGVSGQLEQQNSNEGQQHADQQNEGGMTEDADLFDIKQRVKGMDEEAARLIQLQTEMEQQMKSAGSPQTNFGSPYPAHMTVEEKAEIDLRSIYVGNVDYSATAQELEAHFHGCGSINRVTILCDKFSGHPKGFAYIEFGDKDSVQTAMALDDSLFKGRQIKVVSKRTNRPGISSTDRGPSRGGARGGHMMGAYGGGGGPGAYGGVPAYGYAGGMRGGRGGGAPYVPGGMRGAYSPYMKAFRGKALRGGRGGGFFSHYAPY